jgi:hypothetical protein
VNVRFGSKADICIAIGHVRFTPDNDRESGFPHKVMSALPSKADMCSALAHVCFGPIADIERLTKKDRLAAVVPRPLCKFGIEKDVERSDLSVDNDDIQSGVVWGLAFRA